MPQIAAALHTQPTLSAISKYTGKDQCGGCSHGASFIAEFVDVPSLHTHRFRKGSLS